MAISATGRATDRKIPATLSRGFTLLEVLVVLLLLSVILTFAVLSVDTGPEELRREGDRLASLMQLAAEEAVMNSREYRVVFLRRGYFFELLRNGKWQDPDDELLRPRELPPDYNLELSLDGQPVTLAESPAEDGKEEAVVLLLSSGEMNPFELSISAESIGTVDLIGENAAIRTTPVHQEP